MEMPSLAFRRNPSFVSSLSGSWGEGGMRRIRFSGKNLEVETQEGILKAGSQQSEA